MALSDAGWANIGLKKWLIALWAFLECACFSGLIFGWGSLVFVLKDEGIYADLCTFPKVVGNNHSVTDASTTPDNTTVPTLLTSSLIDKDSTSRVVEAVDGSFTAPTIVTSGIDGKDRLTTAGSVDDFSVTGNVTAPTVATLGLGAKDSNNTHGSQIGNKCSRQEENLALCFTIASAMFCFGGAVMGQISFKFGTRVTRITGFVTFTAATIMLTFVSADVPWLIYPGLSLLAVGGLSILVTNIQVCNLFLKGSSTVVGAINGGFDMSSAIQLVVKRAYQSGFTRQHIYIVITALHSLTLVSTFGFLPKMFIPNPVEHQKDYQPNSADKTGEENGSFAADINDKETWNGTGKEIVVDPKTHQKQSDQENLPRLKSCIKQPVFLTHCLWFFLLELRFYCFMGSLNNYLNRLLGGQKDLVSYFTDVCFYTLMGGLLSSLISGYVYDWQKKRSNKGSSTVYRRLVSAVVPLGLASLLFVLFSCLTLVPSPAVLYPLFICLTLARSFLYCLAFAFLIHVYSSGYFGIMNGIMIVTSGIFTCLQYAFFAWSESYPGAPLHADICLLVLVFLSFLHPACIYLTSRKEEILTKEKSYRVETNDAGNLDRGPNN